MKILVADSISERGVEILRQNPSFQVDVKTGLKEDQLCEIIGEYDALIVRSQTKVTKRVLEAAKKLMDLLNAEWPGDYSIRNGGSSFLGSA